MNTIEYYGENKEMKASMDIMAEQIMTDEKVRSYIDSGWVSTAQEYAKAYEVGELPTQLVEIARRGRLNVHWDFDISVWVKESSFTIRVNEMVNGDYTGASWFEQTYSWNKEWL